MISERSENIFNSIREETARKVYYNKPSSVLKNLDSAEKFIQKVYSQGKSLSFLEEIANQITKLISYKEVKK